MSLNLRNVRSKVKKKGVQPKKAEKARKQERLQKEADERTNNQEQTLMPIERLYKYDPALLRDQSDSKRVGKFTT